MILKHSDIFNPGTLNIFTDASIKSYNGETIGCPGAIVVETNDKYIQNIINIDSYIIRHSTNNNSEISAINLGIDNALKYRDQYHTINLFSDSNICVQGLTDWIFNWVNCVSGGLMYGSSGTPVANQHIFLSIIYKIVNNNLNINIYHQKGHVNILKPESILKAQKSMMNTNKLSDIELALVENVSIYNDAIDLHTKDHLDKYVLEYEYISKANCKLYEPVIAGRMIMNKYKELIGE
ncbi:MAG: RNase H family protein [Paraclostridium sp.]